MEDNDKRLRMAVIAGAAKAIRFKEKNPKATEQKVIQHVLENVNEILENIDNPL